MLTAKLTVFILDQGVCLGFLSLFPSWVEVAGMLQRKHASLPARLDPGAYTCDPSSPPTPLWKGRGDPSPLEGGWRLFQACGESDPRHYLCWSETGRALIPFRLAGSLLLPTFLVLQDLCTYRRSVLQVSVLV